MTHGIGFLAESALDRNQILELTALVQGGPGALAPEPKSGLPVTSSYLHWKWETHHVGQRL